MSYTLLKEIITYAEEYQSINPSNRIEDFTIWLNTKLFAANNKSNDTNHDELLVAFKLMHLNKELKKRTKTVLSGSNISSIDEYSFLLHLNYQNSFRKMEIIDMHNLEAPTGIEIIKRLLKNKFIEEFPDEEDKRAKRIRITQVGVGQLNRLKPQVDAVFQAFTEPLSLEEKVKISGMFDKLIH